jgi:ABC-2 type transport system permease protein
MPVVVASVMGFLVIGSTLRLIVQDQDYFDVSSTGAAIATLARNNGEDMSDGLEGFASLSLETRKEAMGIIYTVLATPLLLTFWLGVLIYLFLTFYQQKKNRSILFWKSMPISDEEEVLSKISALCVYTGIYWLCLVGLQLLAMLMMSVYGLVHEVSVWETFWTPASLAEHWPKTLLFLFFSVIWCLPIYGWTLFVSAWAKSAPLAWLAGVPVALSILEMFYLGTSSIARLVFQHSVPIWILRPMDGSTSPFSNPNFSFSGLAIGTLLGCLLLVACVLAWRRAEEI